MTELAIVNAIQICHGRKEYVTVCHLRHLGNLYQLFIKNFCFRERLILKLAFFWNFVHGNVYIAIFFIASRDYLQVKIRCSFHAYRKSLKTFY